jgi:exosortase E/protease (VPEID-CTERM system)
MSRSALHGADAAFGVTRNLRRLARILPVGALFCVELGVLAALYWSAFAPDLTAALADAFASGLAAGGLLASGFALCLTGFLLARSATGAMLLARVSLRPAAGWMTLHVLGFALLAALPSPEPTFAVLGAGAFLGGAARVLWPAATLRAAGRIALGELPVGLPLFLLGLAVAAVFFHEPAREALTGLTFHSVAALLALAGEPVLWGGADRIVALDGFAISVQQACSGVEGFALIGTFLMVYLWLFRRELRFPRAWLLLPAAILLSWCLNVVRIAMLAAIGAYASPELAANNFHSHSGWLMFTLLTGTLAMAAHASPWMRAEPAPGAAAGRRDGRAFRDDRAAAEIVPFIVFMASALVLSTFSEVPELHYPLRVIAMLASLALFHRVLAAIAWRPDAIAIAAGAAVGLLWVVMAPAADPDTALAREIAAMAPAAFAVWAAARIVGTVLLVPLIEELFFRGYLLGRLDRGGLAMRLLALAVSSGLFGLLHGRWEIAVAAGLVFGLLMLRRGRIGDAVAAHAAANAIVAGWAAASGDWGMI